ncbi:MAG: hypothetical protein HC906_18670 [Bacteroidales bacterium]|nr:hypothetical protein [Bacteroidales bacterium]
MKINLVYLNEFVEVEDDFFIGWENPSDSSVFVMNMALHPQVVNTAFVYFNEQWVGLNDYTEWGFASAFDVRVYLFDTIPAVPSVYTQFLIPELTIHPNPATQHVIIEFPKPIDGDAIIQCFTLSGQQVFQSRFQSAGK